MGLTPTLEERLANYRETLDAAIAERVAVAVPPDDGPTDLDVEPVMPTHRPGRTVLLVAAAAVVVIGGLVAVAASRDSAQQVELGAVEIPPAERDAESQAGRTPPDESLAGSHPVPAGTSPATVIPGSGTSPECPSDTGTADIAPPATLYLGGPAWEGHLAAPGFIFSLPSGETVVDVALKSIALPIIGRECGIRSVLTEPGVAVVTVTPPAAPQPIEFNVTVAERDGVVGTVAVEGTTRFEATSTTLRLVSGIPAGADRLSVRFKKGDDVWWVGAAPITGWDIALEVPAGELDRFPDEPVDWVLFAVLDAQGRVLDAGGEIVED